MYEMTIVRFVGFQFIVLLLLALVYVNFNVSFYRGQSCLKRYTFCNIYYVLDGLRFIIITY